MERVFSELSRQKYSRRQRKITLWISIYINSEIPGNCYTLYRQVRCLMTMFNFRFPAEPVETRPLLWMCRRPGCAAAERTGGKAVPRVWGREQLMHAAHVAAMAVATSAYQPPAQQRNLLQAAPYPLPCPGGCLSRYRKAETIFEDVNHLADICLWQVGARRKAKAFLEKPLAGAVAVEGGARKNGLQVHRFP